MLRFLLVVVLFAALTYALVWTILRRRGRGGGDTTFGPRGRRTPPTRQVAPDDDEDFLRWLERKHRSHGQERPPEGPLGGADDDGRTPEKD